MRRLFIDTGPLLALALAGDSRHAEAVRFVREQPGAQFVLSNLVLAELATRARARGSAARAAEAARSVLSSRRHEVIFVDEPLMNAALARLEQFHDKRLSLTDCVSFELMDRFRLQAAFTFDADFRDCGYRMVP
jgi:predicted nucleic acid-binding protein